MGLHGLLQGYLYFFFLTFTVYVNRSVFFHIVAPSVANEVTERMSLWKLRAVSGSAFLHVCGGR
jgi:hypothetical protein